MAFLKYLVAAAVSTLTVSAFASTVTLTSPIGNVIPTNAQAFIGSGSWQAPGNGTKSEMYFTPASLGFSTSITLSDIQTMSWAVNSSHTVDWYLTIYTTPLASGNDGGWYRHRLVFEGLYANHLDLTTPWVTFTTDPGTNQVKANDSNHSGNQGTSTEPTLQDLQAGPISYSTSSVSYTDSSIKYFALSTGSGWADYAGYLDDFTVTLTSAAGGASTTIDFEAAPVPLPASVWGGGMIMLGALGLLAGKRITRKGVAVV